MPPITFRSFTPADAPRLVELQGRCLRVCPDIRGPGGRQRDGAL